MDENPYKAPQTEGGAKPLRRPFSWRRFLDLQLLLVVGTVIALSGLALVYLALMLLEVLRSVFA